MFVLNNSILIYGIIQQMSFDTLIYIFTNYNINSDRKTVQKIFNYLINENIFPLKISLLRQDVWYLGIPNLCQNTHFTYKIIQYTCLIGLATLAHMINGYEICLNTKNYPFVNIQDLIYWLCTYYFDQLVRPLCIYILREIMARSQSQWQKSTQLVTIMLDVFCLKVHRFSLSVLIRH